MESCAGALQRSPQCLRSSLFSRPLTLLVYGPRIKKAHSEHTEKGQQREAQREGERGTVRALNIQLERGRGRKRGREGGKVRKKRSCVPVLHLTLLISC